MHVTCARIVVLVGMVGVVDVVLRVEEGTALDVAV